VDRCRASYEALIPAGARNEDPDDTELMIRVIVRDLVKIAA
jgi:hypothetical protein